MASSDNFSPPSHPIPTPRTIKPVPVPRSRTKIAPIDILPENDIMQRISFTSPLQDNSVSLDLRHSTPQRRVVLSEDKDTPAPNNIKYENVTIKTTSLPPQNSLPPSIPSLFQPLLLDPPNTPPPPLPDMSNYDLPPLFKSTAPPSIPPPPLPDMSNYDQAPPFKSMSPPHGPPPLLPDESTYDQPRSLSISRPLSDDKSEYFNLRQSDLMSMPVKKEGDDDDYLDPLLLRPKNKLPLPKKTTESVLLHFDPLYENIFINTNSQYMGHLEDIFKPSDQEKRDIKAFNGENASSLNKIPEEINENSEDPNNWEDFIIIGGKNNSKPSIKKEENAFGYDVPEHIEIPDHSAAFNMNNTTGYGKINKVKKNILEPELEDGGAIPKPPVRMDSIPREDMSKLESPGISNYQDPNIPPAPPVLRSQSMLEDNTQEKKTNKLGRFKSIKGFTNFTKNILQKQNTNAMSMLLSSRPMERPEFGEVDTKIGYTGVLVQPGRDRTEWGVTLANGILKWVSEKGEHELLLQHLTSIAAFTPADTPSSAQR